MSLDRIAEICTYEQLEDGTHHTILYEASRITTELWLGFLEQVLSNASPNVPLRHLTEFRGGMVPINYAAPKMRDLLKRFPHRPPMKAAYIYKDNVLLNMVTMLANSMIEGHEQIRFFAPQDREKAMEWLHQA